MMLSPLDDGRLLIVLQIDHSRVAGTTVAHWGNADFAAPTPYVGVVVAAGGHDSAWWDWEVEPFLNTKGDVIDYYRSNEVLGQTWRDFTDSWIERLSKRDIYSGFLVSMHHQGLLTGGFGTLPHMPDRSNEPYVAEFAQAQTAFREELRKEIEAREDLRPYLDDEIVMHNYKLVQMGDQFGQILCNRHPFNSTKRKTGPSNSLVSVPTRPGEPDTTLTIQPIGEDTAVVTPWPFDEDRIDIRIPARVLPQGHYDDHDTFLRDYLRAEQMTVTRILQKAA
ncbi:MAG: hypothetical protein QOH61_1421 [Chloroflexota bacterium]|jgi:hypothetical protein|nr:hypothetical protein [Chloroflexota bacterium]